MGRTESIDISTFWNDETETHQIIIDDHEDSIIGRTVIARGLHVSIEQFGAVLRRRLAGGQNLDADSEDWLRHALHQLQDERWIPSFDREALPLHFAHGYLANRQADGSGPPAVVVYPETHPAHKESHKAGFCYISPHSGCEA